ncbi:MAG: hypothetical protein ACRDYX_06060 [Egibacteraceae bacterium]
MAAYAIGVEMDGDEVGIRHVRLVYLRTTQLMEEIDLGGCAFLLTPELAISLRAPVEAAPASPAPAIASAQRP